MKKGDARTSRPRVVARSKAVDCSNPGTTKLARVEENIGAATVELTRDDLREIDSAAAKITVQSTRYPEELEKMTYR
jgi:diketogulonate reductase-like aldo/keto reductase